MRIALQAGPVERTLPSAARVWGRGGLGPLGLCDGCACTHTSDGYRCMKPDGVTNCDTSCRISKCCGGSECQYDPLCGGGKG